MTSRVETLRLGGEEIFTKLMYVRILEISTPVTFKTTIRVIWDELTKLDTSEFI
jgi:hypothetical protein